MRTFSFSLFQTLRREAHVLRNGPYRDTIGRRREHSLVEAGRVCGDKNNIIYNSQSDYAVNI